MKDSTGLLELAQGVQPWVVDIRRHLHQHPEVRWKEDKTLDYILKQVGELDRFGVTARTFKGGLVVDYDPDYQTSKPRLLFRADVDALPIQEETGLPFASLNLGVSHACGHDTHAAMLLGAMKVILEGEVVPTCAIRFVFQRAEENPIDQSGGSKLVEEGVLADVDEAHALHIWSPGTNGAFISKPGPFLANSGRIKVNITCKGGHVAEPHKGSNAVEIGADVVLAMRQAGTRILGLNEPISLVPAVFEAGKSSNVRPGHAELWFALRNFLAKDRLDAFKAAITAMIGQVIGQYADASFTIEFFDGHPALSNSPAIYQHVLGLLEDAGQQTELTESQFGGEDFAHYLECQGGVPGGMWMLGAKQEGSGNHHQASFNPDESVFWRGVLFWLLLATR